MGIMSGTFESDLSLSVVTVNLMLYLSASRMGAWRGAPSMSAECLTRIREKG